jgi:hypothetical protein
MSAVGVLRGLRSEDAVGARVTGGPFLVRRRSRFHFREWDGSRGAVLSRDAELGALTVLCRELAKLGLNLGLSDARPAVVIRMKGIPPLWITVDTSGEFFEWCEAEKRHAIADPPGAASQLAEYVKAQFSAGDAS